MEYGAPVWDLFQNYNSDMVERVQGRAARFIKSRYSRYSSVSDILDVATSFSKETEVSTLTCFSLKLMHVYCIYIINY